MKSLWQAAIAFCVLLVVPGPGEAGSAEPEADPDPEQLSEKAAEATRRGMEAAEQSDWPAAITAFKEAQRESPFDSAVLFRLALANDKGGRELPAACWYRAYLAAAPRAGNAEKVRRRVEELEKAVRERARTIVGTTAKLLPIALEEESRRGDESGARLREEIRWMAYLQAFLADGETAAATLELEKSEEARSTAGNTLMLGLVRSGDSAAVVAAIDRLPNPERRVQALWTAVAEKVSSGDYVRAAPCYAERLEGAQRDRAFCQIATILAKSGWYQESKDLLPRISAEFRDRDALSRLGWLLADGGEVDAGISLIERIQPAAEREDALSRVVRSLAGFSDDVSGAQRVVARITESAAERTWSERWILLSRARAGDAAEVREAAARIHADLPAVADARHVANSRWMIARGLVLIGDCTAAEQELPGMEDWQKADVCLAMVAKHLSGGNADAAARAAGLMPKTDPEARQRRLAGALVAAGRGEAIDPAVVEAFNRANPSLLHDVVASLVQTGNAAVADPFVEKCATPLVNEALASRSAEEQKRAEQFPSAVIRAYLQATVSATLFRRGEPAAARAALAKAWQHADNASFNHSIDIGPEGRSVGAYEAIATELADAGYLIGPRETVRHIPAVRAMEMDASGWEYIAEVQRLAGDPAGARRTLARGAICAYSKAAAESEAALEAVHDATDNLPPAVREMPRIAIFHVRRAAAGLVETLVTIQKAEFQWGAADRQRPSERSARTQP